MIIPPWGDWGVMVIIPPWGDGGVMVNGDHISHLEMGVLWCLYHLGRLGCYGDYTTWGDCGVMVIIPPGEIGVLW